MTRADYVAKAKGAALQFVEQGDPQKGLMELICQLAQQSETDDLNARLQRSLLFSDLLLKPEPRRVREFIDFLN